MSSWKVGVVILVGKQPSPPNLTYAAFNDSQIFTNISLVTAGPLLHGEEYSIDLFRMLLHKCKLMVSKCQFYHVIKMKQQRCGCPKTKYGNSNEFCSAPIFMWRKEFFYCRFLCGINKTSFLTAGSYVATIRLLFLLLVLV